MLITVEVRSVNVDEWEAARDIRLAALADSPSAFGSTLQREFAFDELDWGRRVEGGHRDLGQIPACPSSGIYYNDID